MTSYQVALIAVVFFGTTVSFWVGFLFGTQRERRHWTRTVTHRSPDSTTVMIDDAMGMKNGDIIVAFDSRTGKPRRRG